MLDNIIGKNIKHTFCQVLIPEISFKISLKYINGIIYKITKNEINITPIQAVKKILEMIKSLLKSGIKLIVKT